MTSECVMLHRTYWPRALHCVSACGTGWMRLQKTSSGPMIMPRWQKRLLQL